jgi:hypothetical protein
MVVPPVELACTRKRLDDHPDVVILRQAGKIGLELVEVRKICSFTATSCRWRAAMLVGYARGAFVLDTC